MRNRAQCRQCHTVLESFHELDYVSCKCGEISISGGGVRFETGAKDYSNFLRVDDDDNVVEPKFIEKKNEPPSEPRKVSREEVLDIIKETIKGIENLPQKAMSAPITHYDYLSLLHLISALALSAFDDCAPSN